MTIQELFKGKIFITDLGASQLAENGNEKIEVGRYAVWSPLKDADGHRIVEVSDNLDMLKEKYGVNEDRVCVLSTGIRL